MRHNLNVPGNAGAMKPSATTSDSRAGVNLERHGNRQKWARGKPVNLRYATNTRRYSCKLRWKLVHALLAKFQVYSNLERNLKRFCCHVANLIISLETQNSKLKTQNSYELNSNELKTGKISSSAYISFWIIIYLFIWDKVFDVVSDVEIDSLHEISCENS